MSGSEDPQSSSTDLEAAGDYEELADTDPEQEIPGPGAAHLAQARWDSQSSSFQEAIEKVASDSNWEAEEVMEAAGAYQHWDTTTTRLADMATVPFLLQQLPQIILNFQNLMEGKNEAVAAISWKGMLTGLAGNLSLLSYFATKRERGAMVVQAVGVTSNWIVLLQELLADAMPHVAFMAVSMAVAAGFLVNFFNYHNLLPSLLWSTWQDFVFVAGLCLLPQVMWSTFTPFIPESILPGILFAISATCLVVLVRAGSLPPRFTKFIFSTGAWTATLLFMWYPIAQMWSNILAPENVGGLSIFTVLLAACGNGLLLPRALFIRDIMWFTGSAWGCLLSGWGILFTMYLFGFAQPMVFWAITIVLVSLFGGMFYQDSRAHSLPTPMISLLELLAGGSLK